VVVCCGCVECVANIYSCRWELLLLSGLVLCWLGLVAKLLSEIVKLCMCSLGIVVFFVRIVFCSHFEIVGMVVGFLLSIWF